MIRALLFAAATFLIFLFQNCSDGISKTGESSNSSSEEPQRRFSSGQLELTVLSQPPGLIATDSTVVTFDINHAGIPTSDLTVGCSLNGSVYTDCESPLRIPGLPQGNNNLKIKVSAEGSNEVVRSLDWVVDSQPSTITIHSGPPESTLETSATFSFLINENETTVQRSVCQFDSEPEQDCFNTFAIPAVSPGSHSFRVTVEDSAGNVSTATHQWTVYQCTEGSELLTTAGPLSYQLPSYFTQLKVEIWGGGGSGASDGDGQSNGADGGTTSFDTLTATGGSGGFTNLGGLGTGGLGSGGDENLNGNIANVDTSGANAPGEGGGLGGANPGGGSRNGLDGTAPGGGGSGGHSKSPYGSGGGSGGYASKTYLPGDMSFGSTVTATIGAGGVGPTTGYDGGDGANGGIRFTWSCN